MKGQADVPGWSLALAIVAAGVGLRAAAARGDLWLDEIWSVELGRSVGSAVEVLTRIHHDNNHPLNTAWLRLVEDGSPPLAYRLLAVASAAGLLLLGTWRGLRDGRAEGLAAAALLSGSYLLVHYGSEARGYAPAACLALAAFVAFERWLEGGRRRWAAAVAAAAVLGLLSHLTFVYVLAGLAAWGALAVRARRAPPLDPAGAALLAVPVAAGAAIWLLDVRWMTIGGGPEHQVLEVLRELLRTTFGLPAGLPELLGLLAAGVAAWEIVRLAREGEPRWIFFAVAIAGAPAAILAVRRPDHLAPRYFLVGVPFVLLLLARALGRTARRGRAGRIAWGAALIAFAAVNAVPVARLLEDGRGRYAEAVAYLGAHTPDPVVTVASDHAFRNGTVLAWYARRRPGPRPFAFLDGAGAPPRWFLRHDFSEEPPRDPAIEVAGRRYDLAATFPFAGLSGWHWLVYRRAD